MTRKDESPGRRSSAMSEGGPWGTGQEDAPARPERDGPRSPWTPPPGDPSYGQQRGPSAFDELMQRARGSFGGPLPGRPGSPRRWLLAAGGLLLVWLGLTCLHNISDTERGLVSQLGSYSRTLEPGMNLTLPAPFETVRIVETGEVRSVSVGATGNGENLLLTGDRDLINIAFSVNWTVSDPRQFAFQLAEPDATVRQVAQSAMHAAIANVRLGDMAAWDGRAIEDQVRERMQAVLDGYGAGIHVQAVAINKADPPRAVAAAINEVAAARKARDGDIGAALTYAAQKAAFTQREIADFEDVYAQYKIAPEVTKRRYYYETMEAVLKDANKTVIDANGVTLRLPRHDASPTAGGGK